MCSTNEPSKREFSLMAERSEFGRLSGRATSFLYDVLVTLAAIDTFESIRHAAGQYTRSSLADQPFPIVFCPFSRPVRTKSNSHSPPPSFFLCKRGHGA